MGKDGEAGLDRLAAAYPPTPLAIGRAGAETAARQGNKERAEELARQVVEGAGESLDARVWQARILNTLGKPEEAEKALRDLIDKAPRGRSAPGSPWSTSRSAARSSRPPSRRVEEMIARVKNVERPELVWAQAWRVAGERDRADSAFDAALARWPDDPRVGRAAADYYAATGRARAGRGRPRRRAEARRIAALGRPRPGPDPLGAARRRRRPGSAAWDLVKDPAPGGDLPEDRLIRAMVLSRGRDARQPRRGRQDARASSSRTSPATCPTAATARNVLARLLIRTEPGKAAEYAAADAQAADAGPPPCRLHTTALIAAKKLDDADRQLDRLAAARPGRRLRRHPPRPPAPRPRPGGPGRRGPGEAGRREDRRARRRGRRPRSSSRPS